MIREMFLLKFLVIFLVGDALSMQADEIQDVLDEGELSIDNEAFSKLMFIVPGVTGYSPHKSSKEKQVKITDIIKENNEALTMFMEYVDKGFTKKGLTFNIYDDNMRGAAIALFRLLQDLDEETVYHTTRLARKTMNMDMIQYAWRLAQLYSNKFHHKEMPPPFIMKPNYYANSETIIKANKVKLSNGLFEPDEASINQFYRTDDVVYFNTNYSGWYSYEEPCEGEINYFREDVGLNSYYYGIHLLHPFWMSNAELDEINPRHAEHYYYSHQQLMARYLLEKEHLKHENCSKLCENMYNPYLMYENGLQFPTRTSSKWEWSEGRAFLTSIDIAMQEFISRGLIIMDNGAVLNMTTETHTDILAKLIRANLDGVKAAKIVRSLYGYGGNVPSVDEYNPAPSVLHHPETSLRDPVFWDLIKCLLKYFIDYKNSMVPFDLSDYETDEFVILDANIPNITTYFSYYEFDISDEINNKENDGKKLLLAARQRRLKHVPFRFDFDVESKKEEDVIVRFFLGPKCVLECWDSFDKFYELDIFNYKLKEGTNSVSWISQKSTRLSSDYLLNLGNVIEYDSNYSMFKFPETLLIPHGLEQGLNLTLFVMLSPVNEPSRANFIPRLLYQKVSLELDDKPLGFPFHRQAVGFNFDANNYKFYNITIYHKKSQIDQSGYFTDNLY